MRSAWNAVIAEMVGTFLFFFVGMGSISVGTFAVSQGGEAGGLVVYALAHGLALAVLVSAFAAVSGAHFNPAVTFGVWLTGHIASRRAFAGDRRSCAVVSSDSYSSRDRITTSSPFWRAT